MYITCISSIIAYMLLYLTVVNSTAGLGAHMLPTATAAGVFTAFFMLLNTYSGGYCIHLRQIPIYWSSIHIISPQRWLLPLLLADEYSADTLANTVANQLCRNKQVRRLHFPIKYHFVYMYTQIGSTPGNHCSTSLSNTQWNCIAVRITVNSG